MHGTTNIKFVGMCIYHMTYKLKRNNETNINRLGGLKNCVNSIFDKNTLCLGFATASLTQPNGCGVLGFVNI